MDKRPQSLPLAVRVMNRAGRAMRSIGVPLVRLDADSLLGAARTATGLTDFGDDWFRGPLARLVDSYENEAQLTMLGRVIARRDAVRLLGNRLRLADTVRRHPEIERAEIHRPLFILGMPRTGTTILHELLAQDPANRVPMTWEVFHPWPPPERATYDSDPRIAEVEKHFAGIDRLLPDFKRMHPMGALLPQECVAITAHEFATMIYHTSNRVPSYQAWLESADLRPVYAAHKRWLQYLGWRCPGERWILKSPGHLWALDALLAVYPDARIVQMHRDPLKVVASLTSLITTLRSLASDDVDPLQIGADWTARLASGLDATTRVRDSAGLGDDRVIDIHFHEFVGNEIATIRRIYDRFGLVFERAAEERIRAFLAVNPKDKHGAHRYRLSDAGLDEASERKRYAAYQGRYAVRSEAVD
jgi:hypothetical protein